MSSIHAHFSVRPAILPGLPLTRLPMPKPTKPCFSNTSQRRSSANHDLDTTLLSLSCEHLWASRTASLRGTFAGRGFARTLSAALACSAATLACSAFCSRSLHSYMSLKNQGCSLSIVSLPAFMPMCRRAHFSSSFASSEGAFLPWHSSASARTHGSGLLGGSFGCLFRASSPFLFSTASLAQARSLAWLAKALHSNASSAYQSWAISHSPLPSWNELTTHAHFWRKCLSVASLTKSRTSFSTLWFCFLQSTRSRANHDVFSRNCVSRAFSAVSTSTQRDASASGVGMAAGSTLATGNWPRHDTAKLWYQACLSNHSSLPCSIAAVRRSHL
mmetsp:Transcript_6564/g.16731  ORF Transcript_6564/g.16731 Transcript_6564/m.16731 type:complete len:331 (-) Transcript_6564:595-1587(-)